MCIVIRVKAKLAHRILKDNDEWMNIINPDLAENLMMIM